MNRSIHYYFILIALGAVLILMLPGKTTAEKTTKPPKEVQSEEIERPGEKVQSPPPILKPDLPKMAEPKHEQALPTRRQLKGSVQHSEVIKPNSAQSHMGTSENGQIDGSSKLNGSLGKGMFNLKSKKFSGGINQNRESGLGIIGLKFAIYLGRTPIIYQVFPETPAAAAGLQPRDTIIAIDGIPTFGLSKNEVYNMIVGKPGTEVTLSYTHNRNFQTRTLIRMDVNAIPDPRVRRDYLSM